MLKYDNTVSSTATGQPIYGAQVAVYEVDANNNNGAQAAIYADEAGTMPLSQPILTDQAGYFAFYIGDGKYNIRVMTGTVEISRTNITMVDSLQLKQRALLVPINEDSGTLPSAGDRAGMLLGFDAQTGSPTALAPNSFPGPTGPANSTYANAADVSTQAAPSNKSAIIADPSRGGTFALTEGDFSQAIAADPDGGVFAAALNNQSGTQRAWVRIGVDEVDPRWFGASTALADNIVPFNKAEQIAFFLKVPILVPAASAAWKISPFVPRTGARGRGSRFSVLQASSVSAYSAGQAIITLTTRGAELSGFSAIGLGTRLPNRSDNLNDLGFNGDGVRFAPGSGVTMAYDVRAEFCRNGVDFSNNDGHIGLDTCYLSNNWNNLYITRNTGDFPIINSDLTGAQYACINLNLNTLDATAPGGVLGLRVLQTHLGFAPYGIRQDAGNATVALADTTLDHCRFEQVGNRAISVAGTNSTGVRIISCGHSFADPNDANLVIKNNVNHPVQDYACVYNNVAGGSPGSNIEIKGNGWFAGTSGFHTKINVLLQFVKDDNGTQGYQVVAGGSERVMDGSQPGGFTSRVTVPQGTALSSGSTTIAVVNRTGRHANAGNVTVSLPIEYSATNTCAPRVRANGTLMQVLRLNAGSGNVQLSFTASLPQSTTITIDEAPGVTLFPTIAGTLVYRADYGGAGV